MTTGRRVTIVALFTVLFATLAVVFADLHGDRYTASAEILLEGSGVSSETGVTPTRAMEAARQAATDDKLVSMPIVARRAAARLGDRDRDAVADAVTIQVDPTTNVVTVNASAGDPQEAAGIADAYAAAFVAAGRASIRGQVAAIADRARGLTAELVAGPSSEAARRTLETSIAKLRALGAIQTGNATQVQPAVVPAHRASPVPLREAGFGGLVGLTLGVAVSFLLGSAAMRIRDEVEIGRYLGLPILGRFPHTEVPPAGAGGTMPLELSADACRWLWTQLRYCNVDRTIKTVLVLSATDGEGTTTVAWNLARSAAAAGRKTVVIESDLRTSTLARMPGVATAPGLTELLSGQATLEETLQPADGPTVVVSGSQPPNLRGMLESRAMSELVKRLREDVYEMVIVDAPPLYPSGLPAPLLREVDGILVVARIGTVSRAAAQRLESDLREIGAPVLGVVANDLPVRRRPSLRWART